MRLKNTPQFLLFRAVSAIIGFAAIFLCLSGIFAGAFTPYHALLYGQLLYFPYFVVIVATVRRLRSQLGRQLSLVESIELVFLSASITAGLGYGTNLPHYASQVGFVLVALCTGGLASVMIARTSLGASGNSKAAGA